MVDATWKIKNGTVAAITIKKGTGHRIKSFNNRGLYIPIPTKEVGGASCALPPMICDDEIEGDDITFFIPQSIKFNGAEGQ